MHALDPADHQTQRAEKLTRLLASFEDYIIEVVKNSRDQAEIIKVIQEAFQRSMKASSEYYDEMAYVNYKGHHTPNENYHALVASVYKSFLK